MAQVHGLLFGTGSSAVPAGNAGRAVFKEDAPKDVQDSIREYVGGEGITIKES